MYINVCICTHSLYIIFIIKLYFCVMYNKNIPVNIIIITKLNNIKYLIIITIDKIELYKKKY